MAMPSTVTQLGRFVLPVLKQAGAIKSGARFIQPGRGVVSYPLFNLSTQLNGNRSCFHRITNDVNTGVMLNPACGSSVSAKSYHSLSRRMDNVDQLCSSFSSILVSPSLSPWTPLTSSSRSVTKFSLRKARRKTVAAVKNRFYRLDWGAWISPQPGRARHLWKKREDVRKQLRHHIFRSPEETLILNDMCTKYWVKKKYFVDDPYESYHTRDNYSVTRGVDGVKTLKFKATYRYSNNTITPPKAKLKRQVTKMRTHKWWDT